MIPRQFRHVTSRRLGLKLEKVRQRARICEFLEVDLSALRSLMMLPLGVLLCLAAPLHAAIVKTVVVKVIDGDTIKVRWANGRNMSIRLAEIDAPERRQPWAAQSTGALRSLVGNKAVVVRTGVTDQYGRVVGRVFLARAAGGYTDVNLTMVRAGQAWAFKRYLTDKAFEREELAARSARRGLWALPASKRTAPWEWRADHRNGHRKDDSVFSRAWQKLFGS